MMQSLLLVTTSMNQLFVSVKIRVVVVVVILQFLPLKLKRQAEISYTLAEFQVKGMYLCIVSNSLYLLMWRID